MVVVVVTCADEMNTDLKILVKWSGKEYDVDLNENDTITDLKNAIHKRTGVRPDRQKLLNLRHKGNLKMPYNIIIDENTSLFINNVCAKVRYRTMNVGSVLLA